MMTAEPQESRSTSPFQEFFRTEAAGGALLVGCACAALIVANSGWADAYHRVLATTIAISAGGHELSLTVHRWINEGLMAVFFLLVGLEIKAGLILLLLITLNVLRIRSLTPYLVLGVGLWYFVHESDVHATIAGVLLAFAIPTRTRINAAEFSAKARGLLDYFDRTETGDLLVLTSKGQQEAIIGLERASEGVTAPLLRLEHALHGLSAFVVMPLFAFSNAGVGLSGSGGGRVALAVILGLTIGNHSGLPSPPWPRFGCGWRRFQTASIGRRCTDAPGWVALDSRCHCLSRRSPSTARTCSTLPKSEF
jgi:Na+/H+ antiporter NhaA